MPSSAPSAKTEALKRSGSNSPRASVVKMPPWALPPFDGAHPGEIMRKIVEEEPTLIRQLNSRVPTDLVTIVENALAKNPDERYAGMDDVLVALKQCAGDGGDVLAQQLVIGLKAFGLV